MYTVAHKMEVNQWINMVFFSSHATTEDMTDLFLAFTQSENVGAILGDKYSTVPWEGKMLTIRNAVAENGFESETFLVEALKAIQALEVLADQYLESRIIDSSIMAEIKQSAA